MQKDLSHLTTPVNQVLFRASSISKLAQTFHPGGLSDAEKSQKEDFEKRMKTPIGLTAKQSDQLKEWDSKIENGETLTANQMEKRDDFKSRLVTMKGLTPAMQEAYNLLIEKENRKPELSKGAKTYVKEVWLWYEKAFRQQINSKYLKKGIDAEEDAITLISITNNVQYSKNITREVNGHLTGECDIHKPKEYIRDAKCVWNPLTFMNSKLSTDYEWQLRAYMYLYDVPTAYLDYCLVDCPPEVLADEFRSFCWKNNILDPDLEKYQPLIEQFHRNMVYSDQSCYTMEERIKTFEVERCPIKEQIMLDAIDAAIDYYPTIKLNMRDE